MYKINKLLLAGVAALMAPQIAHATVYDLSDSIGTLSVTGTITTDSNVGNLQTSDITTWNLIVNSLGTVYSLTPSTSTVFGFGQDLSATATSLYFNFGDTNPLTQGSFSITSSTSSASITFASALSGNFYPGQGQITLTAPKGALFAFSQIETLNTSQSVASVAVPGPIAGAGLPALLGLLGLGLLYRRQRSLSV